MQADFDPGPVILTGRHVRIEPIGPKHAADLLEAGRDEAVWRYMPVPPPKTLEDSRAWIEEAVSETAAGRQVAFAIIHRGSGKAVGSTRLLDIRRPDRGIEIGWTWIGQAYQRSAVNTECKLLLLEHAFESLGAARVQLKTDGRNEPAQRAIQRLGATREGVLRRNTRLWDGHIRDTVYYSILDTEWAAAKKTLQEKIRRYSDQ